MHASWYRGRSFCTFESAALQTRAHADSRSAFNSVTESCTFLREANANDLYVVLRLRRLDDSDSDASSFSSKVKRSTNPMPRSESCSTRSIQTADCENSIRALKLSRMYVCAQNTVRTTSSTKLCHGSKSFVLFCFNFRQVAVG